MTARRGTARRRRQRVQRWLRRRVAPALPPLKLTRHCWYCSQQRPLQDFVGREPVCRDCTRPEGKLQKPALPQPAPQDARVKARELGAREPDEKRPWALIVWRRKTLAVEDPLFFETAEQAVAAAPETGPYTVVNTISPRRAVHGDLELSRNHKHWTSAEIHGKDQGNSGLGPNDARIAALYDSGLKYAEIAERVGVCKDSVTRAVKRFRDAGGVTKPRRRGVKPSRAK